MGEGVVSADYKTLLGLVREFVQVVDWPTYCDCTGSDIPREYPDLFARSRAAIAPSEPKPTNDPKLLHVGNDDDCCRAPFQRDAREGKLDSRITWDCPKCGTEWKMGRCDGFLYHWTARVPMAVIRL